MLPCQKGCHAYCPGCHKSCPHFRAMQEQQRRDLATLLDVEVIGDMHELFGLRLESREHCRVAVAKATHTDTSEKVKILTTIVTDELHAVTFDKLYRRATKGMHNVVGFERLLSSK